MRPKILLISLFLLVLLSSCVPATFTDTEVIGGTTLRHVYSEVYNQSMALWRNAAIAAPLWLFFAIVVTGVIVAIFFSTQNAEEALVPIIGFFFVVAVLACFVSWNNIKKRGPPEVAAAAQSAMTAGVDKKKQEVSERYAELLNFTFSATFPELNYQIVDGQWVKVCHPRLNWPTNCSPYEVTYEVNRHEVCTTDSEGDKDCHWESDTQHDPIFTHLVRYGAQVAYLRNDLLKETALVEDPNNPDHPIKEYSEWMIPANYTEYWWGGRGHGRNFNPSQYTAPADWSMYREQQLENSIMGVTTWHQYSNPLLATANADFIGDPVILNILEGRNMLLQPRDLYSPVGGNKPSYFDFVYPLGEIANMQYDWAGFRTYARLINLYYGNTLHIVGSFAFVSEEELMQVGIDLDTLAYNLKADMYREEKWQRRFGNQTLYTIMQQNTVLTTCVVSEGASGAYIKPSGCRVVVGLPIGNEVLKEAYLSGTAAEMQDVPFTPTGFFGQPSLRYAESGDLVLEGTTGTPIGMWDRYGAKKPSMGDNFGYLVDRIELGQQEITEVVNQAVASQADVTSRLSFFPKMILLGYLILGLLFLIVGFLAQFS